MKRVLTLLLLTLVLGLSVSPAVAEEVFSLSEAVFASPNVWDASYRAANLTILCLLCEFFLRLTLRERHFPFPLRRRIPARWCTPGTTASSAVLSLRGYLFEAGGVAPPPIRCS